MWSYMRWNAGSRVASFLLFCVLLQLGLVSCQTTWKTLSGKAPVVVSKGGFSGLFPDSSKLAYKFAPLLSTRPAVLQCDVRLTKDLYGICLPDIKMDNCTDIPNFFPNTSSTYLVNGVSVSGYFPIDYSTSDLVNVSLMQAIYTRTYRFDSSFFPILAVEDVAQLNPPALWLNIEHDMFYAQHNLSMKTYIKGLVKNVIVNYISSPEIGFLTSISSLTSNQTKLIFKFLDLDSAEPTTNLTYSSLLSNLTYIKTFASGILVPKTYIWPVSPDNYLLDYTTVVVDAHKAGLEVYAGNLANDNLFSYNYSYDPLAEYLSYIDNGVFSVDGLVTEYPVTPSEAISCFMNLNKSSMSHGKPLVISHNGASGDYPDCTDLAYQYAVDGGADIIDCPVQVTKDGMLVCMSSINLMDDTTVAKSVYATRMNVIPQLQSGPGVFTFNLTWDEIKKLKPQISAPQSSYKLVRNPRYTNAGNYMNLSDFLAFAKNKDLAGVLITVENAPFIAQKLNINMVDSVLAVLKASGYNSTTSLPVTIQSSNSSVLVSFKQKAPQYKLLYTIDEQVSDAAGPALADIKRFADAVAVEKESIFPLSGHFMTTQTKLVENLQAQGLSVYVYVLMNEFVSQAWDYFSDATVEINSFVQGAGVDGLITDFPATAHRYKLNTCQNMGNSTPYFMQPVQPGSLLQVISEPAQPPALSPLPILSDSDVAEPPLPDTTKQVTPNAEAPSKASPQLRTAVSISMLIAVLSNALLLFV
ncbi:Glycerophosphodiester [Carex littledalei]|uniref:glycerophosphodiester phosphodiesterase n=1 Tax=Carex littledalei TaxID=544730 RepID=A0A833QH24_9POAL|nr:Glycerophosphodiester [Carex littledalei]